MTLYLKYSNKINIKVVRKMSHIEMYNLFQQARISISLAVSDGLPGVLVEAMECGAFPIQSENSAVNEFLIELAALRDYLRGKRTITSPISN